MADRRLPPKNIMVETKDLRLDLSNPQKIVPVARALASIERVSIIKCLGLRSMNVQELAKALDLPVSSTALHVKVLEEAGLIMSESLPAARGAMKLCSRRLDHVGINLVDQPHSDSSVISLEMPIGGYSRAIGIEPTCGLASSHSAIGEFDNPDSFYLPDRFAAEIVWFRQGFLEYLFGMIHMEHMDLQWLELSFEACSEAPMHRNPWKSDISVLINEKQLGIWTSPADLGGRRGLLNPKWWPDVSTQFGMLKTWRIDQEGSYLENVRTSSLTIQDLDLEQTSHLSIK
ncbi:MAG: helix-turn-helix domain-containing protein, partial [Clostridiales bacterium]|nr:helix-turn-helix domain-containing protein [Clostridiales bacterium]